MATKQRIIPGDCIAGLRTLPDASVHCCVTSPPYWGLRDYGTATWEGGDAGCDHQEIQPQNRKGRETPGGRGGTFPTCERGYRDTCGKCGARRIDQQLGLEATPEAYVARMVEVFREVRRVLRDDGTLWLNLGDSYNGSGGQGTKPNIMSESANAGRGGKPIRYDGLKHKDLVGIPWRVALALQADGWWLRQDIIWHKPNPMPESVRDRCTKAHEYVFLLTKSERYFYDAEAVSEAAICDRMRGPAEHPDTVSTNGNSGLSRRAFTGTRNRRSVWTITTKPYSGAHFAVMPPDLVEPCIKAGCPEQCCPVCGKGWERAVEREKRFESGSGRSGNAIEGKQDLGASEKNSTPDIRMGPVVSVQTLGWAPACDCNGIGTTPGTVLDPFAGSGTTLAVAAELGRNAIGCELNPDYIELAERRILDARQSVALFEAMT